MTAEPAALPNSKLDQLKTMSVVVADTGDLDLVRAYEPEDCTTNPTLLLKTARQEKYRPLLDQAREWAGPGAGAEEITDRLAVIVGAELVKLVPGRVSTEVDADLSFDTEGTVAQAERLIELYESRGVSRDRVLVKIAATWEGIRAAETLQKRGIDCNLTLLFSLVQAAACAEAGVFLISPFVGRILDWYVRAEGRQFTPEEDPGVLSLRRIHDYVKGHGYQTIVMGASFRSVGQIEAVAGCERLTISPALLDELAHSGGTLTRRLGGPETPPPVETVPTTEVAFRWAVNEDAMATEKLAEGIRQFNADLLALRQLITEIA